MAGAYQSRNGSRGVVVEAVCDEDLWIWHLFVGALGSFNDINVMNQSPLYLDVTAGRWPPREVPFSINRTPRTLLNYIFDDIHPGYAFLVSPQPMTLSNEAKTFNRLQETIRKDVERLFGVLTERFHVDLHPGRCGSVKHLIMTDKAVCILHRMCVEARRDTFWSRRTSARGANGEGSAGGERKGHAGAAAAAAGGHDAQNCGSDDGGAAAAGGAAPGGGIGNGGRLPAATDAATDPPPALNAMEQPPAGGIVAFFDAWGETRNPSEHEQLRPDLKAYVWNDRGELLGPYVV